MIRSYSHALSLGAVALAAALSFSTASAQTISTPPAPAGLTEYLFGSPSGDEVEMLECINRARANPAAEGQRVTALLQANDPTNQEGNDYARWTSPRSTVPARRLPSPR